MTRGEVTGNTGVLIIAGSETTATLLSGATYFLLKNPRVLEKLKTEVRSHFQSIEEINIVSSGQLPYLHAVLEEALRLYPPVPSRLPRRTGSNVEIIDGHVVPPYVCSSNHRLSRLEALIWYPRLLLPSTNSQHTTTSPTSTILKPSFRNAGFPTRLKSIEMMLRPPFSPFLLVLGIVWGGSKFFHS